MIGVDKETNPSVVWKMRRKKILECSFCKPHRSENATRHSKRAQVKKKRLHKRK